jgi:hypothetical protein
MNRALAAGLALFIAGVIRDLQWHATHNTQREFETASKRAEVHWLLWASFGIVGGVVLALLDAGRAPQPPRPAHERDGRTSLPG